MLLFTTILSLSAFRVIDFLESLKEGIEARSNPIILNYYNTIISQMKK